MDTYLPEHLGMKDLILLEASIACYRLQDDDEKLATGSSTSKFKAKQPGWERWRALLELCSISLISKAPVQKNLNDDETTELLI